MTGADDEALKMLAASQFGLVSRSQATQVDYFWDEIHTAVRQHKWRTVLLDVYWIAPSGNLNIEPRRVAADRIPTGPAFSAARPNWSGGFVKHQWCWRVVGDVGGSVSWLCHS